MVSPEIQRVAISDYAAARGYEITGWVEGIDESGSRARSAWWPTLERSVAAVEAGEYDVLVVWKFSRVARHRLRWATAIDRVEAAGGRIESATEQFDTTTSSGRLARGMVGELNAFMAEQIGEGWKEAHDRRVAAGKPANGKPRWGYRYDVSQRLHVPDPQTGPVLAEVYRRYVAGESVHSLVRWLNAHGYRTLTGGLWSDRTLRRVLDSGFAAGRFLHRGQLHDGVHEPLIDGGLWQAYADARARRRAVPARRERSQYLLSGLVRCARCQRPMVAGQFGARGEPKYRCKTGKEQGPQGCSGGYVMATYVEGVVKAWLEHHARDVDAAQEASLAARARRASTRSEAQRIAREMKRLGDALTRLAVQHAETPLPQDVYRQAYGELTVQLTALEEALEAAQREERAAVTNPRKVARELLRSWDTTPVHVRRTVLGDLMARVDVTTGRPRASFVVWSTWGEPWSPPVASTEP